MQTTADQCVGFPEILTTLPPPFSDTVEPLQQLSIPRNAPLLQKDFRPRFSPIEFPLKRSEWDQMVKSSRALFQAGEAAWSQYQGGDEAVKRYMEFGLPPDVLKLLQSATGTPNRTSMRFDYYLTEAGPRMIEISRNPWALLEYTQHVAKSGCKEAIPFDGDRLYGELLGIEENSPKKIALWNHFDTVPEMQLIQAAIRRQGSQAEFFNATHPDQLQDFDSCLVDLDTALLFHQLPLLLEHQEKIVPSAANILFKHKSFLPLAYGIAGGDPTLSHITASLNQEDLSQIRSAIVPTGLLDSILTLIPYLEHESLVVKEVVGMWGKQVSILHPHHSEKDQALFQAAAVSAAVSENAIYQEYITPRAIEGHDGYHAEVSVIFIGEEAAPFVRIYSSGGKLLNGSKAGLAVAKFVDE